MPKAYIKATKSAQEPTTSACFPLSRLWLSQVGRKERGTSRGSSVLNFDKIKAPAVWRPAKPVFFTSTIPIILGLAGRMTQELLIQSTSTRNFPVFEGPLAMKIYQDTSELGLSNTKKILQAKNLLRYPTDTKVFRTHIILHWNWHQASHTHRVHVLFPTV